MTDDQNDPESDASRTDPETAGRAREELAKQAERGIERAMSGNNSDASNDHLERDPAEGSRETVEQDLARKAVDGQLTADHGNTEPTIRGSSPGSEAAEPSPER